MLGSPTEYQSSSDAYARAHPGFARPSQTPYHDDRGDGGRPLKRPRTAADDRENAYHPNNIDYSAPSMFAPMQGPPASTSIGHGGQREQSKPPRVDRRRAPVAPPNPYPTTTTSATYSDTAYAERPASQAAHDAYPEPSPPHPDRHPSVSPQHERDQPVRHTQQPQKAQPGSGRAAQTSTSTNGNGNNAKSTKEGKKEARAQKTLSCMECRRLKLKCDRIFPCQSCCKRGCAEICPEGALTSGRGSRFILANTEHLHEKITQLQERVRQLEEALENLHIESYFERHPHLHADSGSPPTSATQNSPHTTNSSYSPLKTSSGSNEPQRKSSRLRVPPHPLLTPPLLRIKTSINIPGENDGANANDAADTNGRDPAVDYAHGLPVHEAVRSGGLVSPAEVRTDDRRFMVPPMASLRARTPDVPSDIVRLSAMFPYPWQCNLETRKRIRDMLPSQVDAKTLCEDAKRNALWQFNLDASNTFIDNLLHHVYTTPFEDVSPRRLALLLMNLAVGTMVGGDGQQSPRDREQAARAGQAYVHLARASLTEMGLLDAPDLDLLHCLFYMVWYNLTYSDDRKAVTYAWNMTGFVTKLSQGLGLHRDTSKAKVIPEEDERRRAIFWEILNLDYRLSLSLGRPPSLCLSHIDTKPPRYDNSEPSTVCYHDWKMRFLTECLHPVLQATVQITLPAYEHVVQLDARIREFGVPPAPEGSRPTQPFFAMQKAAARMGVDVVLLQLHRRYFLKAMCSPGEFDLDHELAPSVVATYVCSSSLITATEALFESEPTLSTRFIHFWFNLFGAATALRLLITRVPQCPLSKCAVQELRRIRQIFRSAAQMLPFCANALVSRRQCCPITPCLGTPGQPHASRLSAELCHCRHTD
ncbi:hypothetical protein HGRIS_006329 [Hohenbuehelia grisea]|uniref:Zn(2)-C6 fungal-type domain-containing protein n=1 Tax=Hohenbuehelia grisea TaxID=104357 RepID=A0ABR3K0K8_9AGAR